MEHLLHRVLAIALLVEITTNFVKKLVPNLDRQHITIVAGCIGIFLAITTRTGILKILEIPVQFPAIDYLLTGIIMSRGANIVHDLAKKLNY